MACAATAGVYEIRNTLNNKVYIGSSINISKRLAEHERKLHDKKHGSAHLQAAWDKHGACNFAFKTLLVCDAKNVLFYEQILIDGCNATNPNHGYNKRIVAQSNAGIRHSEETKRRVSASMVGRVVSAETRRKISIAKLGTPHTANAREKMRVAHTGRKLTVTQVAHRGKLIPSQVAEIRALYATEDVTQSNLAAMFGVCRESIGELLRGDTWLYQEAGSDNILSEKNRKERRSRSVCRGDRHHNFGKDWGASGRLAATKVNCHSLSDDQKLKIALAKSGKKMPDGFGAKMRLTRLGKAESEETKRRKSEARKNMSVEKADSIRRAHSEGVVLVTKLSEMFAVSKRVIRSVLAGDTWVGSGGT